jgi:DNA-binding transcriptional ArsR family regulator
MADGAPVPEEITDLAVLKALAHPLRRRIMHRLRSGPASATTLATYLGENTGATSYHLRELAKHGFIEEATDLARGRERWWRMRQRDLRFPHRSAQSPEMRALFDDLNSRHLAEDLDAWARFQAQSEQMGDWADAVPFSRATLHLSQEEIKRFFDEYMALVKRYWRPADDIPPQARQFRVRFIAFPEPDPE